MDKENKYFYAHGKTFDIRDTLKAFKWSWDNELKVWKIYGHENNDNVRKIKNLDYKKHTVWVTCEAVNKKKYEFMKKGE